MPGMNLDQPPAAPPTGGPAPMSGVSTMFRNQLAAQQNGAGTPAPAQSNQAPGAGMPQQQVQILAEAVKRGLQQLCRDPKFAPFGERMLAVMDAGMQQVAGAGAPQQPQTPNDQSAAPQGAPGGDSGAGAGFPG